MTASEWAAWWGAIVASIILGWDVYKWKKSKSNVRINASPNMQALNEVEGKLDGDDMIFVEVINNGDSVTTITHLIVKHYSNLLNMIRRKTTMQGFIPTPGGYQQLPYELATGKRWTGMINQKELEEKTGKDGYLFCGINHTASKRPTMARVKLKR